MTWHLVYREDKWIRRFQSKFWSENRTSFDDPENACAEAISQLLMTKLPAVKLKNNDNLDGFVMGVFSCIVSDLARRHAGRLRPPSLLKRKGGAYLKIFFEFCIQNNPADIIARKLKLPELSVKEVVSWLKARDKCPRKHHRVSLSDETDAASLQGHEALMDASADPAQQHIEDSNSELSSLLDYWFTAQFPSREASSNNQNQRGQSERNRLGARLAGLDWPPLNTDERLLLKLYYWEGISMSETARLLNVSRKKAQRLHTSILARLESFFKDNGITD